MHIFGNKSGAIFYPSAFKQVWLHDLSSTVTVFFNQLTLLTFNVDQKVVYLL